MRARYVILRVLIEAGLVNLERLTGDDGEPDVLIHLDREKIATAGRDAIGKFLLALQARRRPPPRPGREERCREHALPGAGAQESR